MPWSVRGSAVDQVGGRRSVARTLRLPPSPTHRASWLPASRWNTPPTCCGPPPPRPLRAAGTASGWKLERYGRFLGQGPRRRAPARSCRVHRFGVAVRADHRCRRPAPDKWRIRPSRSSVHIGLRRARGVLGRHGTAGTRTDQTARGCAHGPDGLAPDGTVSTMWTVQHGQQRTQPAGSGFESLAAHNCSRL